MKKYLGVFIFLCAAIVLALLLLLRGGMLGSPAVTVPPAATASSSTPGVSSDPTPAPHMTPDPTPEHADPTPEPIPETEPESFVLSFIGDLTLASSPGVPLNFWQTINGDYAYPFSNVKQYFADDEYTLGNLECTFSDQNLQSIEYFNFRAPTEYANILLEGGVDFVTTANNHTNDFREAGKRDTWATLENYDIAFGKNEQAQIVTTPNGLKLGIYCLTGLLDVPTNTWWIEEDKAVAAVRELKAQGPDLIICMFHMGAELNYYPEKKTADNCNVCRRCIDEGADIIYSSHPHCLQPIEAYNGGLIFYSMGNFIFGGNSMPKDQDTAIVQLTVTRASNGNVSLGDYSIIPCCIASKPVTDPSLSAAVRGVNTPYNDLRPTPYEEGTDDYVRALSKINGTYDGPDGRVDYTNWHAQHG